MRTLRIRTMAGIGLYLIFMLPWLFYMAAQLVGDGSLRLGEGIARPVLGLAIVAGLLAAFVLVGIAMRRYLLKPLERMGQAARQIASGHWDVELPESRVTEIAEVGDGFKVMVDGLQQSYRKQAALEEERRFVIAAVAHDLRTPLFALRGYLDGIDQGIAESPEKLAKYVAVCKEKSAQVDRLVEDLFTFAKLDYAEAELDRQEVDLSAMLESAIDSLRPLAEQKHVAVQAGLAARGICTLRGDAHLLERAVTNLLDNAVRHTPPQGVIDVRAERDAEGVSITVRDTGPGFSEEELEHAFDPLYRGEASRNRATGGAGLGLTIAQRIIRQHGGTLAAGNHPDGGALLLCRFGGNL